MVDRLWSCDRLDSGVSYPLRSMVAGLMDIKLVKCG